MLYNKEKNKLVNKTSISINDREVIVTYKLFYLWYETQEYSCLRFTYIKSLQRLTILFLVYKLLVKFFSNSFFYYNLFNKACKTVNINLLESRKILCHLSR